LHDAAVPPNATKTGSREGYVCLACSVNNPDTYDDDPKTFAQIEAANGVGARSIRSGFISLQGDGSTVITPPANSFAASSWPPDQRPAFG